MPLSVRGSCGPGGQRLCLARWDLAHSAAAEVGVGADLISRVLLLPALVSAGFEEGSAEPGGRLPCVSQRLFLRGRCGASPAKDRHVGRVRPASPSGIRTVRSCR